MTTQKEWNNYLEPYNFKIIKIWKFKVLKGLSFLGLIFLLLILFVIFSLIFNPVSASNLFDINVNFGFNEETIKLITEKIMQIKNGTF